jgi:hypothetical protein
MAAHDVDRPVEIHLGRAELHLIRVALRLLLASEDDPETIEDLKRLLARLAKAEADGAD